MPTLAQTFDALPDLAAIEDDLPTFITANLNPRFPLRPYQRAALARFIFYAENYGERDFPAQLLFHMATGSGKTLVMAAAMLYLYRHGYRNFVFFVNSTTIIEKTRDNFLNRQSSKYLFSPQIVFGTRPVTIRDVPNFQSTAPNEINVLFTTIQGLHARLNHPQENAPTFEDFSGQKVALISDEAHHLNTLTKRKLNRAEKEESTTWEYTVNRIFQAHADNFLLEFTATAELEHPAVRQKYADKLLVDYSLREFREDGYSKDVRVLQTDIPPIDRALQAVLLSQYRRKIAAKFGLNIKPVLLLKSRTIRDSEAMAAAFRTEIAALNGETIARLLAAAGPELRQLREFLATQSISLNNFARELREDFSPIHTLSVNSKSDSEEKQLLLNSLEDDANPVRAIFAVDKLNEGWDVLNLFDIVRLYDTRDTAQGRPGKTTIAEAQLIGRGARYFPFQLSAQQPADRRKFDADAAHELRILETLHYHSAHNPRYIQELRQVLVTSGLMPAAAKTVPLRVKPAIKQTDFWKHGTIWLNTREKISREHIHSLPDLPVSPTVAVQRTPAQNISGSLFEMETVMPQPETTQILPFNALGKHTIQKALHRLPFFSFDNLSRYFPHLRSLSEFATAENYLGGINIALAGDSPEEPALGTAERLRIALAVLETLARDIRAGAVEYRGSRVFAARPARAVIADKRVQVAGEGVAMPEDWFVFDSFFGTAEESEFVAAFRAVLPQLQARYGGVHLLQNWRHVTLYRFADGQPVSPSFVLFLRDAVDGSANVQVFISVSGGEQRAFFEEISARRAENSSTKLLGYTTDIGDFGVFLARNGII